MPATLRMLPGRMLVKFDPTPSQTSSGIFLPEEKMEEPTKARVIHDGDERYNGKTVEVSRLGGEYINFEGERLCIVKTSDILLVHD